jgi:threonine dehydrogenase-like Zn-dependent dehydrogenase
MPGGADVVVDAVGSVLQAIRLYGGTDRDLDEQERRPEVLIEIMQKRVAILGSYISNHLPATVRLVESGQLNLTPISATIPIEETAADRLRSARPSRSSSHSASTLRESHVHPRDARRQCPGFVRRR